MSLTFASPPVRLGRSPIPEARYSGFGNTPSNIAEELTGDSADSTAKDILIRAAACAGGIIAADLIATGASYVRPKMERGIVPVDTSQHDDSKSSMIVVPGYTQRTALDVASPKLFYSTLGIGYNLYGLSYDPFFHNNKKTADRFQEHFSHNRDPFSLLGISLGTPFALGGLALLARQGIKIPHIDTLVMHSSPHAMDSLRPFQQKAIKRIANSVTSCGTVYRRSDG
jgi:hypothetical protein